MHHKVVGHKNDTLINHCCCCCCCVGVKFSAIFLDYFRMPTGYALEVYKQQLFTQFVPELIRLGAADLAVPVYVPNNTVLLTKLAKEG